MLDGQVRDIRTEGVLQDYRWVNDRTAISVTLVNINRNVFKAHCEST